MTPLLLLTALAALATLAAANGVPPPPPPGAPPPPHNDYPNHGYGGHGGHGHGGHGHGGYRPYPFYGGYVPAFGGKQEHKEPTLYDKQCERMADLEVELSMADEELNAALSRMAGLKAKVEQLSLLQGQILALSNSLNTDEANVRAEVERIRDIVIPAAEADLNFADADLGRTDSNDPGNQMGLIYIATETRQLIELSNVAQDRRIGYIEAQLPLMKERLTHTLKNAEASIAARAGLQFAHLNAISERVHATKCESGTVTMHMDDRRAEVLFQRNFGHHAPQIDYGISGYQFDMQAGKHHSYSQGSGGHGHGYGGYGHQPTAKTPNAVGVWVAARPSPDGITFVANNLGFGDTELTSVTVSYHACNFGSRIPGGANE